MKRLKKSISIFTIMIIMATVFAGCGSQVEEQPDDNVLSDNIILTETGETLILPQKNEQDSPHMQPAEEKTEQEIQSVQEEAVSSNIEEDIPTQEQAVTAEEQAEQGEDRLQIVFLGDSIFDNNRDGTGVPYLTTKQCNADCYNMAIGGTSATIELGESTESETWESRSMLGIVKAMKGEISTDIFEGTRAKEILDDPDMDFSQTDYFIVEYGINDFFRAVPLDNDNYYDYTTYAGALRYALAELSEIAVDATIIVCCPHYCQFFNDEGHFIGDGNVLNTGYGTLVDYKGVCKYVAKEQQVKYYDAYVDLGINGYTAEEYLEDGVHLTEAGRQLYADALAAKIMKIEETKNN